MTTVRSILGKTTIQAVLALGLTSVFCYLAIVGTVPPDVFGVQVATVIAFYFLRNTNSNA